ncbi:SDR family NAD(P)-dependent oxidoreductase [Luedemannella flava]
MIGISPLPAATDAADPWTALFKKVHDQYSPGTPFNGNAIYGMSVAYLFVQALQAAGKDLTREGLIAAVEKGGFTGPGYAPLRYSRTNHSGYGGGRLTRVASAAQAFFGPVYETDPRTARSPSTPSSARPRPPAAFRADGLLGAGGDPTGPDRRQLRSASGAHHRGAHMRHKGRVAIVTGASRGIGLGVAERLVAEGARVCLTARGEETLAEAVAALGGPSVAMAVAGRRTTRSTAPRRSAGSPRRSGRWTSWSTTPASTRRSARSSASTSARPARSWT